MTCFSIQKSLRFLAIPALIPVLLALLALPAPAFANNDEIKKRMRDHKERIEEQEDLDEKKALKTDAPIVIELFTTVDCSACVFADRMLYDAMQNKNVVALSCKIDDTSDLFSDETRTAKPAGRMDPCLFRLWTYQSAGARERGDMSLPRVIFGGRKQLNSNNLTLFKASLNREGFAMVNKTQEVFSRWKDDDTITIHLPQDPSFVKGKINASVWIARYKDMEVVKVEQGINKGRVLRFSNVMQDIRHVGKWHGAARSFDVDVPKPAGGRARGGYAVLVQEMMGEPVLAAGKLKDYPHPEDVKREKAAKAARAAKNLQQDTRTAPAPIPPKTP